MTLWISFTVFLMIGLGLYLDFSLLPKERQELSVGLPNPIPWGMKDWILIVAFFLFFQYAIGLWMGSMIQIWPILRSHQNILLWIHNFIVEGATILFLWSYLRRQYQVRLSQLGLFRPLKFESIKKGFLYYCASLPFLIAAGLFAKTLAGLFRIPIEPQLPLTMFLEETTSWKIFLMSVFIVFVAPFFEEIFFRGFLYPLLRKYMGVAKATILSSVFFGSLHFNFNAFFSIVCIGIFLAYLYEKTGSLFASIIFHSLNNLVAVLLVLYAFQ